MSSSAADHAPTTHKHKNFIAGTWQPETRDWLEVHSPYTRKVVGKVAQASAADVEHALKAAASAFDSYRYSSRYSRSRLLSNMSRGIVERKRELVHSIIEEAGKPVTLAAVEVDRAIGVFAWAAEETKRFGGEVFPPDADASGVKFGHAWWHWVPRGVALGIGPFNFPLVRVCVFN